MQDSVNAKMASAIKSNLAVPSFEALYLDSTINSIVKNAGKRLMASNLISPSDIQDEEEDLKLKLIGIISNGKFDPSRSSLSTYASRIAQRLAGRRINAAKVAINKGKPAPSQFISINSSYDDGLLFEESIPDPTQEEARLSRQHQKRIDTILTVVSSLNGDERKVWDWLLEEKLRTGKINVSMAARHFKMERTKFIRKYIDSFKKKFTNVWMGKRTKKEGR